VLYAAIAMRRTEAPARIKRDLAITATDSTLPAGEIVSPLSSPRDRFYQRVISQWIQ